jgi:hypothetical protein
VTIVDYNTLGGSFTKTTTLSNPADWFTAKTETALPSAVPLRVEFKAIAQNGGAILSHRYEYVKIPANGSITLDAVTLGATYEGAVIGFTPATLYIQPKNWNTPNRVLQKLVIGNSDTLVPALTLNTTAQIGPPASLGFNIENKDIQFTPANTIAGLAREGTAPNFTNVTQFTASYSFTPRTLPNIAGVDYEIGNGTGAGLTKKLGIFVNTTGGTNVTVE